jgi:hypothetical protein
LPFKGKPWTNVIFKLNGLETFESNVKKHHTNEIFSNFKNAIMDAIDIQGVDCAVI